MRSPLKMKKTGIIGWPVSHSRSPLIHNRWIAQLGLDAVYERCPIDPQDDFRAALDKMAADGFVGANVTIPHKETAFAAMDRVSDTAAERLGCGQHDQLHRRGIARRQYGWRRLSRQP